MPELPEVETMRRGILAICGASIEQTVFPRCRCRPLRIEPSRATLRRRIGGQTIADVRRLGKRVVITLGDDQHLVFEPRMTGLLLVNEPPDRTHLRFGLRLSNRHVPWLWYWDRRGLGTIRLLSSDQLAEQLGPQRLGPDALAISASELRSRLQGSRRAIKVALLDQKVVAGIGNLYASEILHVARIDPATNCTTLRPAAWKRLHEATHSVLRAAIADEGSTLSDGTYRNALNQNGRYQNRHCVYDKAGAACPRCRRGTIRRIVQAQRSTFYCDQCQRG